MKIHIIFTEAGELRFSFRQEHPRDKDALEEFIKNSRLGPHGGKHSNFYIGIHTPSYKGDQVGLDVQNGSGVASYTMTGSLSVKKFIPSKARRGQNTIVLTGKNITLKKIKKECSKDYWRYVIIRGGDQKYTAALRIDIDGRVVVDSGKGGTDLQLVGIDSIKFTNQRQPIER